MWHIYLKVSATNDIDSTKSMFGNLIWLAMSLAVVLQLNWLKEAKKPKILRFAHNL